MTTENKPTETIRDGKLKATIWKNPTKKGHFYSVDISRTYKQGDVFKDSHSFSGSEPLQVARLAHKAYDRISGMCFGMRCKKPSWPGNSTSKLRRSTSASRRKKWQGKLPSLRVGTTEHYAQGAPPSSAIHPQFLVIAPDLHRQIQNAETAKQIPTIHDNKTVSDRRLAPIPPLDLLLV